jgi:N-methylhydantoinase B/oxoprolinase/acetone carboxylase alpha subunit
MQVQDMKAEIAALESQVSVYEKLLDKAISDNVEFAKTKVIFHELKKISDKLQKIREISGNSQ